jgi:hypothetical protein
MRTNPALGLVIGLLVIVGATLGVGSGRAQPSASSTCAQDANGGKGNFTAHAGLGVHVRTLRFDGVEATITPLRAATGLSGCERLGGLVGIGSTVAGTYLVLDLYAQARLPNGFVSHIQWAKGGPYYYVAPALVRGLPSRAGRAHTLRITRLRGSSTWLVEVDNHVVDHIDLPGSNRGLPMPRALLYASNQDGKLNRGSLRFTNVRALPAGDKTWKRFPHGKTWLYTDHPKYKYVDLGKTSFIAKNR